MIQIERVGAGEYKIIGLGKDKNFIAEVNTLEKASCVLRFINGSSIKGDQYTLAVDTIREIDAKEKRMKKLMPRYCTDEQRERIEKWLKEHIYDEETERVSGEADNGVSDGSPSD